MRAYMEVMRTAAIESGDPVKMFESSNQELVNKSTMLTEGCVAVCGERAGEFIQLPCRRNVQQSDALVSALTRAVAPVEPCARDALGGQLTSL